MASPIRKSSSTNGSATSERDEHRVPHSPARIPKEADVLVVAGLEENPHGVQTFLLRNLGKQSRGGEGSALRASPRRGATLRVPGRDVASRERFDEPDEQPAPQARPEVSRSPRSPAAANALIAEESGVRIDRPPWKRTGCRRPPRSRRRASTLSPWIRLTGIAHVDGRETRFWLDACTAEAELRPAEEQKQRTGQEQGHRDGRNLAEPEHESPEARVRAGDGALENQWVVTPDCTRGEAQHEPEGDRETSRPRAATGRNTWRSTVRSSRPAERWQRGRSPRRRRTRNGNPRCVSLPRPRVTKAPSIMRSPCGEVHLLGGLGRSARSRARRGHRRNRSQDR